MNKIAFCINACAWGLSVVVEINEKKKEEKDEARMSQRQDQVEVKAAKAPAGSMQKWNWSMCEVNTMESGFGFYHE